MLLDSEKFWKPRFYHSPAEANGAAVVDGAEADPEPEGNDATTADDEEDEDDEDDDSGDPETVEDEPAAEEVERTLTDFGLPSNDPEELGRHFMALQQQAQAQQQTQARLAQMEAMWWAQQQQAQQYQPQPQQPEKPRLPWSIPDGYQPDMRQFLTTDEEGNLVVKPGGDPRLPQMHRQYVQAQQQMLHMLATDPAAFFQQTVAPQWNQQNQQYVHQAIQQAIYQERLNNARMNFETQYRDILYDQSGHLSPVGQSADQHYRQALQMGHPDPVGYTREMLDAAFFRATAGQQAAAQAATPAQQNAQAKLDILKRGAQRTAGRSGTQNTAGSKAKVKSGENPFDATRRKALADPDFFKRKR